MASTNTYQLKINLQRYIPMLLRRIHIPLILQHLQRVDQPRAGFMRLDDGVEETREAAT